MELFCKYVNIFADPIFQPADHFTHNIELLDKATKIPKPNQYDFLPNEQAEVYK